MGRAYGQQRKWTGYIARGKGRGGGKSLGDVEPAANNKKAPTKAACPARLYSQRKQCFIYIHIYIYINIHIYAYSEISVANLDQLALAK